MKSIKVKRLGDNWVEGVYKGHFFQAKVYPVPSEYGIAEGCTSKLTVCAGKTWNSDQIIFEYDRGYVLDSEIGHEIAFLLEKMD